jgi:HSP20 family protein
MDDNQQNDPMNSINAIRDNLRKTLDAGLKSITSSQFPPLDVYREAELVVVRTPPLDGLDPSTIDVTMVSTELTISGTTRSTDEVPSESYLRRERSFGQFSRTITIPIRVKAEEAKAKVKNGVLTITFPTVASEDSEVIDIQVAD